MKKIQIAIPVFNEEMGITLFLEELELALKDWQTKYFFSLLVIDDASCDQTLKKIKKFPFKNLANVLVLHLQKNVGHGNAVLAGVENFQGDALILMDADFQDKPQYIGSFLDAWEAGAKIVRAKRKKRLESFMRRNLFYFFYKFFSVFTGLESGMGIFGLYDKEVVKAICARGERAVFLPGLVSALPYSKKVFLIDREARRFGKSKVGYWRLGKLAILATLCFSRAISKGIFFTGLLTLLGTVYFIYAGAPLRGWLVWLMVYNLISFAALFAYLVLIKKEKNIHRAYKISLAEEVK